MCCELQGFRGKGKYKCLTNISLMHQEMYVQRVLHAADYHTRAIKQKEAVLPLLFLEIDLLALAGVRAPWCPRGCNAACV